MQWGCLELNSGLFCKMNTCSGLLSYFFSLYASYFEVIVDSDSHVIVKKKKNRRLRSTVNLISSINYLVTTEDSKLIRQYYHRKLR